MIGGVEWIGITISVAFFSVWGVHQYQKGVSYIGLTCVAFVVILSGIVAIDFAGRGVNDLVIHYGSTEYYTYNQIGGYTPQQNLHNQTWYQTILFFDADDIYNLQTVSKAKTITLIDSGTTHNPFIQLSLIYGIYSTLFGVALVGMVSNLFFSGVGGRR